MPVPIEAQAMTPTPKGVSKRKVPKAPLCIVATHTVPPATPIQHVNRCTCCAVWQAHSNAEHLIQACHYTLPIQVSVNGDSYTMTEYRCMVCATLCRTLRDLLLHLASHIGFELEFSVCPLRASILHRWSQRLIQALAGWCSWLYGDHLLAAHRYRLQSTMSRMFGTK
jgi:hypothetical protein